MRRVLRSSGAFGAAAFVASLLTVGNASAEVTLLDKDGWRVFMKGRAQAFLNYNNGDGFPTQVTDGNMNPVELLGGGIERSNAYVELSKGASGDDAGKVHELRLRTGFTGNVLGFGIAKKINEDNTVLLYNAVTVVIESPDRRKYMGVVPDWRESYLKVMGPWGSLLAGRANTLFSRGATEITFLYGFQYGLGFPGSVTFNGPTAAHVGFGVLGNGFGGGLVYATPSLGGLQISAGLYDANNIPGAGWERVRWPRAESEITYQADFGALGMLKLFVNGAVQKLYQGSGPNDTMAMGVGYGGRIELGPVRLGLAGHYGQGIGMNYSFDPSPSIANPNDLVHELRTFDGYYAQLMVAAHKTFSISAGAGITRAKQLLSDQVDAKDNDMMPETPASDDDGTAGPDSVGHTLIHSQLGLSGGLTYHVSEHLHLQVEYFRAMFTWFLPSPTAPGLSAPEQNFHFVNAGITCDF